jgi:hypothetical protein
MMSGVPLETCWAFKIFEIINSITKLHLVGISTEQFKNTLLGFSRQVRSSSKVKLLEAFPLHTSHWFPSETECWMKFPFMRITLKFVTKITQGLGSLQSRFNAVFTSTKAHIAFTNSPLYKSKLSKHLLWKPATKLTERHWTGKNVQQEFHTLYNCYTSTK